MSVDATETTGTRGRKAVPLSDKIAKAVAGELSAANTSFLEWVSAEAKDVEIDVTSFALAATLYQDYTSTEEFQAAAAERKAAREAAKELKAKSEFLKFAELAKKFGKKIVDIDEDDEDSDDADEDDAV